MSSGKPSIVRWLLPAVLVAVVVAVSSGLVAREFYRVSDTATNTGETSAGTTPSGGQAGPPTIQGTKDAVSHPQYQAVKTLLQVHFDAINAKDYDRWKSTVTARRAQETTKERWRGDYETTTDGSIVIHRLESAPSNQVRVLLGFNSVQDVRYAPLDFQEPCIHWNVIYQLSRGENGGWRLDLSGAPPTPQRRKC